MTPRHLAPVVLSAALLLSAAAAPAQVVCPKDPAGAQADPALAGAVKDGVSALLAGKAAGGATVVKTPCATAGGGSPTVVYEVTGHGASAKISEAAVRSLTDGGVINEALAERLAQVLGAAPSPGTAPRATPPADPQAAAAAAARAEKKMAESSSRVGGLLSNPFAARRDDLNAPPPSRPAAPAIASQAPADPGSAHPAGLVAALRSFAVPAPAAAAPGDVAKEEGSHVAKFIAGLGVMAVGVVALTAGAGVVATVGGAALVAGGVVYAGWQLRKVLEPLSKVGDALGGKLGSAPPAKR